MENTPTPTDPHQALEELITEEEVAEVWKIPPTTLADLRKREGWPHVRLGRHVRYTKEQAKQILASHTVAKVAGTEAKPVFEGLRPSRSRHRRA